MVGIIEVHPFNLRWRFGAGTQRLVFESLKLHADMDSRLVRNSDQITDIFTKLLVDTYFSRLRYMQKPKS